MTLSNSSLKKYSSFIVLFLLLLAMSGIIFFGIVPLKQSLNDKMRGIQEYYAGQENREKQVNRLPELKDQFDVIVENEPTFNILITDGQIVDFIKTLENLASETNVQMTITSKENGQIVESKKVAVKTPIAKSDDTDSGSVVGVAKPKAVNILDDIPFDRYLRLNIVIGGQYVGIVSFLEKIETLPIGLDVVGVEIKKVDVGEQGNMRASTSNNPFALLGDGNVISAQTAPVIQKNPLEATFDILVYVDKKD